MIQKLLDLAKKEFIKGYYITINSEGTEITIKTYHGWEGEGEMVVGNGKNLKETIKNTIKEIKNI